MSNLAQDIGSLQYQWVTNEQLKEKDHMKNVAFTNFSSKISKLFMIPFGFQLWQISLINNP